LHGHLCCHLRGAYWWTTVVALHRSVPCGRRRDGARCTFFVLFAFTIALTGSVGSFYIHLAYPALLCLTTCTGLRTRFCAVLLFSPHRVSFFFALPFSGKEEEEEMGCTHHLLRTALYRARLLQRHCDCILRWFSIALRTGGLCVCLRHPCLRARLVSHAGAVSCRWFIYTPAALTFLLPWVPTVIMTFNVDDYLPAASYAGMPAPACMSAFCSPPFPGRTGPSSLFLCGLRARCGFPVCFTPRSTALARAAYRACAERIRFSDTCAGTFLALGMCGSSHSGVRRRLFLWLRCGDVAGMILCSCSAFALFLRLACPLHYCALYRSLYALPFIHVPGVLPAILYPSLGLVCLCLPLPYF